MPDRYRLVLERALRGEVVSEPEDALEREDGTRVYLRWTVHPWRDAGGEVAGVGLVVQSIALLVRARDPEDVGPLWPGVVRGALVRRPGQKLELVDRARALTVDGAEAVGAGVTASDDDDALALSRDEALVGDRIALTAPVLER